MSPFLPLQPNPFPPPREHSTSSMAQALPHAIMYPPAQPHIHYLPQYYGQPAYPSYAPSPYPDRTIKTAGPERRRPKYTRSKTGCLTCRRKKVKCDEAKPNCVRCTNSQLSCTWPEIPPPKKKAPTRSNSKRSSPLATDPDVSYSSLSTVSSNASASSLSPTELQPASSINGMSGIHGINGPNYPLKQEGSSPPLNQLGFPDPQMENSLELLHHSGLGDRRHSEPQLQTSYAPSSVEARRHSTVADITDGQHHNQQVYAAASGSSVPGDLQNMGGGSALGLTLNQYNHPGSNSGTRPSTPNEYHPLYSQPHITHSHPHHNHHQQPPSVAYAGFTPTNAISVLPNISGNGNSRPSTAGSLSIAHSLRRASAGNTVVSLPGGTVAGSRPSTAGSLVFGHRPASAAGSIPMHASNPAVGGADMSMGMSPFQFDSAANTMSTYGHGSRPSTANSVPPSAASSPYMRQGTLTGGTSAGTQAGEAWAPSPLSQPQPLVESYFPSGMMHSPPQTQNQNQDQSPLWSY